MFTTNGAVLAVIKRSFLERELPDLFCFGLLAKFSGYFPGYSKVIVDNPDYLTWAVLKAHTNNQGGKVTLRSANPLERPQIEFNYFETGTGDYKADLASVVDGSQICPHSDAAFEGCRYYCPGRRTGREC